LISSDLELELDIVDVLELNDDVEVLDCLPELLRLLIVDIDDPVELRLLELIVESGLMLTSLPPSTLSCREEFARASLTSVTVVLLSLVFVNVCFVRFLLSSILSFEFSIVDCQWLRHNFQMMPATIINS